MKFLKTGKGKVVAILTAILLVSTAGVAFASSGAGDMLKGWYDGVFETTTAGALDEAETYEEGAAADFEEDYADRKDQKAGQIDRKRERTADSSIKNINAAKDEHIDDLDEEKENILEGMGIEFYNVYMDAWLELQDRSDAAEVLLNENMDEFATAEGEAAVEQLNEDLNQAKEDAVSELEDAIGEAQEELTAELEAQGGILTGNLETQVNHEIEMLKRTVSDTLYDLTKEQEGIIEEKAALLEAEAKDAMDEVLDNMGN